DFSTPITDNIVLYAKWTAEKYTVSFNGNGQTITIASQSVEYGKTATEPAAPTAEGINFGGWYTDKECTSAFDFSTPITADTELFARWTDEEDHIIIGDADVNGKVTSADAAIVLEYVVSGNKSVLPIKDKYADYMSVIDMDGDKIITANDAALILKEAK
ncbi:MAG: InlB B-repeat-containing protein, partial [Firmicutes bacterium]|nr:InlB B-repeat-containing protein [Bacillota bacterium]